MKDVLIGSVTFTVTAAFLMYFLYRYGYRTGYDRGFYHNARREKELYVMEQEAIARQKRVNRKLNRKEKIK